MKQKEKNIVILDISNSSVKALLGSFNENTSTSDSSKLFFELQGVTRKVSGVSKKGVVQNKRLFAESIIKAYNELCSSTGYDIEDVFVMYTHPSTRFYKKRVGTNNIKNVNGIQIDEKWVYSQREKWIEQIDKKSKGTVCTDLQIQSIMADGEEIVYDLSDGFAEDSIFFEYVFATTKANYIETVKYNIETMANIRQISPGAMVDSFYLTEEQKRRNAVVMNIGSDITTVTIFKEEMIDSIHAIDFGGNTITDEIALTKKITIKEAEELKTSLGSDSESITKRDLQSINKKIAAHIKRELSPIIKEAGSNQEFPGGVTILGGGSLYLDLDEIIEKTLQINTVYAKTPYHIQSSSHAQQTSWQSAYALLHKIAIKERDGDTMYKQDKTIIERISNMLNRVSKKI